MLSHCLVKLNLVPLLVKTVSSGMFRGEVTVGLKSCCLPMCVATFLLPWLFGLRHSNTEACNLLGGAKMATSRKGHIDDYSLRICH